MASIQVLERKMNQHSEQFKQLTTELQLLKAKSQRPKTSFEEPKVVKRLTDLVKPRISVPAARKAVRFVFLQFEQRSINFLSQIVKNSDKDESKQARNKLYSRSTLLSSAPSQLSNAETEISTIGFNGSPVPIKCSPLKVLQFLIFDLQSKLSSTMPEGKKP